LEEKEMSLIDKHWTDIQPRNTQTGSDGEKAVAKGFLFAWNHDRQNMEMICRMFKFLNPTRVIELGTFEGMGTEVMAETLSYISEVMAEKVKFATVDAGVGPVDVLGETYGVTKDKLFNDFPTSYPIVDFTKFAGKDVPEFQKSWGSFEAVQEARAERIANAPVGVEIKYFEGLSYFKLSEMLRWLGEEWHFCFQDTVHSMPDILKEWELLKPSAIEGSIIVFDDAVIYPDGSGLGTDLLNFFKKEPEWVARHTKIGHQQVWAEKVK
jgi:hypothetical protein